MITSLSRREQWRLLWFVVLAVSSFLGGAQAPTNNADAVSFQISTDKTTFRAGESVIISLTLVNRGQDAIYVARQLFCGKWTGFSELHIVDSHGRSVALGGCSAVFLPIPDDKLKEVLSDGRSWIRLLPNEIYGEQRVFNIPRERGLYQLKAELFPPQFSEKQRQLLASEQFRVLDARHHAPPLTIKVK